MMLYFRERLEATRLWSGRGVADSGWECRRRHLHHRRRCRPCRRHIFST